MPYLKEAGKKRVDVAAQKGGEVASKKAQDISAKIAGRSPETPELRSAADLVALKPEDETYQTVFAKALASYLETIPEFAKELVDLMGDDESVQEVLAEKAAGSRT
jgi:hypothetical protein